MSMKEFITLSAAAMVLFFIGWFVSFSLDPYRVCIDHPNPKMKDEFFLCKPFDFELAKDTLLRREKQLPWENDGTFFDTSHKRKRKKVSADPMAECLRDVKMQDPDNRLGIDPQDFCRRQLKMGPKGSGNFLEDREKMPSPGKSEEL